MSLPIRVLIADDSDAIRGLLAHYLAEEPWVKVVGLARDGLEAVALAKDLRPDVMTMDVMMPGLDGLEATARIMAEAPCRILMVSSIADDRQVNLAIRAVALGALEVISKPGPGQPTSPGRWVAQIADAIRLMAEIPIVRRRSPRRGATEPAHDGLCRLEVLGIAASTGGPSALARLLGALPGDLPLAICIAQHMTPGFVSGLARWLSDESRLKIVVATEGSPVLPGHVYLAADALDIVVDPRRTLSLRPPDGRFCPGADRLLHSLSIAYGPKAGGIVLTGIGEDGARGLLEIRKAGGVTAAQDRASSVVYGMPRSAAALGAAQHILSLDAMPTFIVNQTHTRTPHALRA